MNLKIYLKGFWHHIIPILIPLDWTENRNKHCESTSLEHRINVNFASFSWVQHLVGTDAGPLSRVTGCIWGEGWCWGITGSWYLVEIAEKCRVLSLDGGRGGGGTACGVGLPVHVDEVRSSGVHNKVQQSEHLTFHKNICLKSHKSHLLSHPGGDVGVHPVLVLLVLPVHETDQDGDKCREVEEGGTGSEPEFLIRHYVD